MKIYTRTGDQGDTGLIGGGRVRKSIPRVAAYGTVDELNATLGLALAELNENPHAQALVRIQNALFSLGAELATVAPRAGSEHRIALLDATETSWLEAEIDRLTDGLPPLKHFILPGGTRAAASLHLARTVCRRAERTIVTLAATEPVRGEILAYVNRLSDYLFVLARAVNSSAGQPEPIWLGRDAG